MNKTGYFLLLALSVSSFSLYAQCPQGIPNTPGCMPPDVMERYRVQDPPYSRRRQAPQQAPQQYWERQYGAIVIDKTTPNVGVVGVEHLSSKQDAENAALSKCKKKGGQNCEIVGSYSNQCGALVWGDEFFSVYSAGSADNAITSSMQSCERRTKNCEVFYSDCSLPILRGPQVPQQYWENQYEAIAIDKTTPNVGVVGAERLSSKLHAENAALFKCKRKGGQNCEIVGSYSNQCGALVWGDEFFSVYSSGSAENAISASKQRCEQKTKNCEVFYSDCSLPVLRSH
ncbi:MAG: DUF4189 domain-containing protein [Candidatus Accumulibacter sp.]|jgi:hypothetical protein|nr:DUF4189 domain-containing protein [Accumulibacter sp.]